MKVLIEKCPSYDYDKVYPIVKGFCQKLNLWERLQDCKTILVKPNLLGAYPPEKAITTHPVVLKAVLALLLEHGKTPVVGDSPGGTVTFEQGMQASGMAQVCQELNVEVVNFSQNGITMHSYQGYEFPLTNWLQQADAVIDLPKYKTHSMMLFTGAIKNLYGLVPGMKKAEYHRLYPQPDKFAGLINAIYNTAKTKIAINIMDGITGMEGEGPSSGKPKDFGVLLASTSGAALDITAARMMGFKAVLLNTLALQSDNLKETDIELALAWQGFSFKNVDIGSAYRRNRLLNMVPNWMSDLIVHTFRFNPIADSTMCIKCGICVKSCPVQAMSMALRRPVIDYDKCINCLCCHELCPKHAISLKKGLIAKLILN